LWKSILFNYLPLKIISELQKIGNFFPEHDSAISQKIKNVEINHFCFTLIGKLGKIAVGLFSERRK